MIVVCQGCDGNPGWSNCAGCGGTGRVEIGPDGKRLPRRRATGDAEV